MYNHCEPLSDSLHINYYYFNNVYMNIKCDMNIIRILCEIIRNYSECTRWSFRRNAPRRGYDFMCSFILEIIFQYLLKIYMKLSVLHAWKWSRKWVSHRKSQKKNFKVDSSRRASKTIGRLVCPSCVKKRREDEHKGQVNSLLKIALV